MPTGPEEEADDGLRRTALPPTPRLGARHKTKDGAYSPHTSQSLRGPLFRQSHTESLGQNPSARSNRGVHAPLRVRPARDSICALSAHAHKNWPAQRCRAAPFPVAPHTRTPLRAGQFSLICAPRRVNSASRTHVRVAAARSGSAAGRLPLYTTAQRADRQGPRSIRSPIPFYDVRTAWIPRTQSLEIMGRGKTITTEGGYRTRFHGTPSETNTLYTRRSYTVATTTSMVLLPLERNFLETRRKSKINWPVFRQRYAITVKYVIRKSKKETVQNKGKSYLCG